jgi:hypothetical protein
VTCPLRSAHDGRTYPFRMSNSFRWLTLIFVALFLSSCRDGARQASCALGDGRVLDASHRDDGFYGVRGEHVEEAPLARFDHMTKLSEGVDVDSGKRWIRFRLTEEDARAVHEFTADLRDRSVAVVVGGEVACHHKLRDPVLGSDVQVSCCNPRACDRWNALLPTAAPAK